MKENEGFEGKLKNIEYILITSTALKAVSAIFLNLASSLMISFTVIFKNFC